MYRYYQERLYIVSAKKPEPQPSSVGSTDPAWADRLNRYFASVGPDTASALRAAADEGQAVPPRPPRVCAGSFRVRPATLPELSAALGQLGTSKASGVDGITVHLIRSTFPVVAPHLLLGWGSLSTCFPQVMGGVGHLCTCARAPPPPPHTHLRIYI